MADLIQSADAINLIARLQTVQGLAQLISTASDIIRNETGLQFGLGTYTELHDGKMQSRVWLRQTPVLSVSSVQIFTGNDAEVIDNSDGDGWTFHPLTGELRRGNGESESRFAAWFPAGLQNVQVTYTAGNAQTPWPVYYACILTVKYLLDSLGASGLFSSESIGSYSYDLVDPEDIGPLPKLARRILVPYIQDFLI